MGCALCAKRLEPGSLCDRAPKRGVAVLTPDAAVDAVGGIYGRRPVRMAAMAENAMTDETSCSRNCAFSKRSVRPGRALTGKSPKVSHRIVC